MIDTRYRLSQLGGLSETGRRAGDESLEFGPEVSSWRFESHASGEIRLAAKRSSGHRSPPARVDAS
jgi:hypothetical protein